MSRPGEHAVNGRKLRSFDNRIREQKVYVRCH